MALYEKLCKACCRSEVSVDLERRMQVEQVRCRTVFHQVLKQLVIRMIAVLKPCPHIELLSHRPAGGSIAAQLQCCLGSFQQFRCLCCNQISRMKRHQL